jgi:hypothetical protein
MLWLTNHLSTIQQPMAIPCRVIIKARPTADGQDDAFNQEFTVPAPGRVGTAC